MALLIQLNLSSLSPASAAVCCHPIFCPLDQCAVLQSTSFFFNINIRGLLYRAEIASVSPLKRLISVDVIEVMISQKDIIVLQVMQLFMPVNH